MQGLSIIPISAPDDPRVAEFANLKDAELRRQEFLGVRDTFIAESELTVRQLLASRCGVVAVLVTPDMLARLRGPLESRVARCAEQITVYVAERPTVEQIAGFAFHRGVLACGTRPPDADVDVMLRDCTSLTILEGISNHDNIGSVFRNVGALGGPRPGVLLGEGCCDPFYRKSLRVSIGHVLDIPFAHLDPWPRGLGRVKAAGWRVLALSPRPDAMHVATIRTMGIARPALLLGAEGAGLTPGAFAMADHFVRIPMRDGVDSLNVAVAGAVAMSHLVDPGEPGARSSV